MIPDHYNRIPLNEQLAGIWQRRKWLFLIAFFLVFPAGVALVVSLPPLYRAQTTLLIGQGDIAAGVITNGNTESVAARLDVIRKAIMSRSRLMELIERYDLYPQYRGQPVPFLVNRLRNDIGIRQEAVATQAWNEEPTITLVLSYQSQSPELAAEVANGLAAMYGQENEELLQTRSARTAEFLRRQLDEVNARLARQEKRLRDFRNDNLRELPEQQSFSLQMLEQLNTELRLNSEAQLALMNRRDAILTGTGAMGFLSNSSLAEAASATGLSELELRRIELNQMLTRYTERHPQVVRLQNEIKRLEAQPAPPPRGRTAPVDDSAAPARSRPELDGITRDLAELQQEGEEIRERIREVQTRIESSPGLTQELLSLNNDYNAIRQQQLTLQGLYEEARLNASMEQEQDRRFQVLEPAIPPVAPAAPNQFRLIVMGFILSVGFAAGLVFLREQFDTSFHTLQEVRAYTKLPVLGSIARIETTREKFRHAFRNLAIGAGMVACIIVLVVVARNVGQDGEELVWMLAGRAI